MNDQPGQSAPDEQPQRGNGDADGPRQSLSLWQIIGSTMAAALGVQSSRNRERDFTHGKAWHFIVSGIVFTVLFVLTVILVVNLVL